MQHYDQAYADMIADALRNPQRYLRTKMPEPGQPMCKKCRQWPAVLLGTDHATPLCGACAEKEYGVRP